MMGNMRRGIPNIMKGGTKHLSGVEQAVLRNIEACKELTKVMRTSLGPNGMNKMIINHLGKVHVTSDAALIIREMEVQHPAAKIVVMASQMQDREIGDGSNFVVCFAGELLSLAGELISMGLHPSDIVRGYSTAGDLVLKALNDCATWTLKDMTVKEDVAKGVKAAIAAKQYGYEDLLAPLVAEACCNVMPKNTFNFNVDNVRVAKVLGGGVSDSTVMKGMCFVKNTMGSVKEVSKAKVAIYTCSVGATETETKGTVLLHNAEELMNYNLSEEKQVEQMVDGLVSLGVKCVVTGSTCDDMALHFLNKAGVLVLKMTSKWELRRLCRATGGQPIVTLAPPSPEQMGYCDHIIVKEVGGSKVTVFEQDDTNKSGVSTVLLRASTNNVLNDMERAIDHGVNVVKAMTRDTRFVPGAGAIDIELARRLRLEGRKTEGLEQYAIDKFADALEVVPRTLAENAGFTALDVISQLYAAHEDNRISAGIDIGGASIKDSVKDTEVLELMATRAQGLKLATDAVTTILRIDQIVQSKPAGGPKLPGGGGGGFDA